MKCIFRIVLVLCFAAFKASVLFAQIEVKFGSVAPRTPWADDLDYIKKRVESESNHTIKIKLFSGTAFGGETEILRGIIRGQIQGGGFTTAAIASIIPEMEIMEIPYLFANAKESDCILDNHLLKSFRQLFAAKGLILVSWTEVGFRNIGNKTREIRTPSDLVGLKLRSQESNIHLEFWKKMGVRPVPISIPEVLPSLQIGVVEGFDQTILMTLAADWQTSIQYYTLTEHIYQPAAVVYSKSFYDKLNLVQKKIIMGEGNGMAAKSRQAVRNMSEQSLKILSKNAVLITKLTDAEKLAFRKAVIGLDLSMVKMIGGKAPMIFAKIKTAKLACSKGK